MKALKLTALSLLLFSLQTQANIIKCDVVVEKGLLETRISELKELQAKANETADSYLVKLDNGGNGWKQIDPKLVEEVTAGVKDYNYTNFSIWSARHEQALLRIETALKESKEFGSLEGQQLKGLAEALAAGNRNRGIPMFGTKHMLYHALLEMKLVDSKDLHFKLIMLQLQGANLTKSTTSQRKLESMLAQDAVKNLKDMAELNARYETALIEMKALSKIPEDLTNRMVEYAKLYQASNMGAFQVLTAGHQEAMKKFANLVKEHEFFKNWTEKELDMLNWNWKQGTTPELATSVLNQMRAPSEAARLKQEELNLLSDAIRFFIHDT